MIDVSVYRKKVKVLPVWADLEYVVSVWEREFNKKKSEREREKGETDIN